MRLIRRLPGLHLAVYGCYLLLALLITWPLVTVLGSAFAGYSFGDAHEMSRHIWWMKHALQTGQPLFFQPLLGYPDGIEGVILWSDPLQFFPGWLLAFVLPLPAAYNIFILLTLALNGWAAFFLVRKLTGATLPAFLGGLIFMTAPVMQGHLAGGHGGLMVQWPLPLYAYALLRLRESPTRRAIALAVLFFVLVPLGHTLQLIYALLPITGLFALTMLYQRDWRTLRRVILVGMLGSVILLVFLLPVMTATLDTGAYTQESGVVDYSADLLGLVTPSFNHPLFGQWDFTHRVLGINIVEGSAYVGLIPALLAAVAIWKQRAARWWLLLALLAWILSLGPLLKLFNTPLVVDVSGYPSYITLPWALVENLPLFQLARTPGRFTFVIALTLAIMAGYGLAALLASQRLRRTSWQRGLALLLGAVIVWEYQSFWPLPTLPAAIPPAVQALAGRDDLRAVFDLPWDNVLAAKDALYLQTGHEHPLIAGQVTRRTPVSPAKLALLATLDPALLNQAGADVVIIYRQYDPENTYEAAARERLGAPLYEDDRYIVFTVPQGNEAAAFTAITTPANTVTNLFAPESGWVDYTVNLDAPRSGLTLTLDEQP
ncbi:MAG: hypothetical protein K8I60_20885, partial [Anaerolineae bacterium]|nr:hypothetical protein [Anaerolineae bacterium]